MDEIINNPYLQELLSPVSIILSILTICAVIIVIIMFSVDMAKAVSSNEEDANKKAFSKAKSRIITLAIFLLVPSIVTTYLSLLGQDSRILNSPSENRTNGELNEYSYENAVNGTSYGNVAEIDGYIDFESYIR